MMHRSVLWEMIWPGWWWLPGYDQGNAARENLRAMSRTRPVPGYVAMAKSKLCLCIRAEPMAFVQGIVLPMSSMIMGSPSPEQAHGVHSSGGNV